MNKPLLIVLFLLISASAAQACIWDRDTLAMERAKFPEVNELIVGYFPRHSSAYYAWRKEQVLAIPLEQRKPSDYDDLGASYDKLGEHEQAIATMLEKIERFPDEGVYETHANLGTFYIHNGDLEQGVQYIGSAIEINLGAHFGREVYQKLLVEYVLEQRAKGNTLPLDPFANMDGFAAFVIKDIQPDANPFDGGTEYEQHDAEIKRAIKGVLGMMRFGNYDSPVLLEALGDLLSTQFDGDHGVQRLASRAYLKASYEVEGTDKEVVYREKAERALRMQKDVGLADIEVELKKEIAKGDAFFAKIEADEKAWIAAGKDLDAMFQAKYYDTPVINASLTDQISQKARTQPVHLMLIALMIGVGLASALAVIFKARRRRVAS